LLLRTTTQELCRKLTLLFFKGFACQRKQDCKNILRKLGFLRGNFGSPFRPPPGGRSGVSRAGAGGALTVVKGPAGEEGSLAGTARMSFAGSVGAGSRGLAVTLRIFPVFPVPHRMPARNPFGDAMRAKGDRQLTIEGSYRVIGETVRPRREPIFNSWRNAVPLLALVAIRALWVMAAHHR
jgi:hypothetical protein